MTRDRHLRRSIRCTKRQLSNLSRFIMLNRSFPNRVFSPEWTSFLFFDSDWIFDAQFAQRANALIDAENGQCTCISNLDQIKDNVSWERGSIFIDHDVTNETYFSLLRGGGLQLAGCTGWTDSVALRMQGDGAICEKQNEIAVVAVRESEDWRRFDPIVSQLGAVSIRQAIERPLSYGFSRSALSMEWRSELISNYS